jgi:DisA bacterial checkpoint controller nucleotide-binding
MIDSATLAKALHDEARAMVHRSESEPTLTREEMLERRLTRWPIPPLEDLAAIIEVVFWASQLTEEGRPCRPRLLHLKDADEFDETVPLGLEWLGPALPPGVGRRSIHQFEMPVPLDVESLRKLSPAHGRLGYLTWRWGEGGAVLTGVQTPGAQDPHDLTIVAPGGGTMHLGWMRSRLVTLSAGEVRRFGTCLLPSTLRGFVKLVKLFGRLDTALGAGIVRALVEQGHGGALWLLPEGRPLSKKVRVGRGVASDPRGLYERWPEDDACATWLASIACLAAVDGAVVLDSHLRVLGFAAFVDLSEPVPVVRKLADGSDEQVLSSALGGGRHRSAVEFCRLHAPAGAVVVSEDGRVTLVAAEQGKPITSVETVGVGFAERA